MSAQHVPKQKGMQKPTLRVEPSLTATAPDAIASMLEDLVGVLIRDEARKIWQRQKLPRVPPNLQLVASLLIGTIGYAYRLGVHKKSPDTLGEAVALILVQTTEAMKDEPR